MEDNSWKSTKAGRRQRVQSRVGQLAGLRGRVLGAIAEGGVRDEVGRYLEQLLGEQGKQTFVEEGEYQVREGGWGFGWGAGGWGQGGGQGGQCLVQCEGFTCMQGGGEH